MRARGPENEIALPDLTTRINYLRRDLRSVPKESAAHANINNVHKNKTTNTT